MSEKESIFEFFLYFSFFLFFFIWNKNKKNWAVKRQMDDEGGFQGRANKLVDGCYSFWVGGMFPLIQKLRPELPGVRFDVRKLADYILRCCQERKGGFRDKPGVYILIFFILCVFVFFCVFCFFYVRLMFLMLFLIYFDFCIAISVMF